VEDGMMIGIDTIDIIGDKLSDGFVGDKSPTPLRVNFFDLMTLLRS
jgi:hypothetical protein